MVAKRRGWTRRALVRYSLLQIPGIAMVIVAATLATHYLDLPAWIAWIAVSVWIVKDIVLFPFLWKAYDNKPKPGDHFSMIGARGIAQERLAPLGYALVNGELWQVEIIEPNRPIEKGEAVRVREIKGLTLMVEPEKNGDRRPTNLGR